jgi:hypothetical protein
MDMGEEVITATQRVAPLPNLEVTIIDTVEFGGEK